MIQHAFGLMFSPSKEWQRIAKSAGRSTNFIYTIILAALPAIAWYYGTSQVGWQVGRGDTIRLTPESALTIAALFYLATLCCIWIIGYFIHWMSATYNAESTLMKGVAIAGYCATPLFLAGVVGFYPSFTIDLLVGLCAIGWALYLLYTGVPVVMSVPQDRGFLFASAILGVCLVIFMALMGATVILWDLGAAPVFVN